MSEFKAAALSAARFAMSPSEPVQLTRGCGTRYPGVKLYAYAAVSPQNVFVTFPPGRGLEPNLEGNATYMLTVQGAKNHSVPYPGVLLPDRRTLVFTQVDLALPASGSTSSAWVAVNARPDAELGTTSLVFTIGPQVSHSALVKVVPSAQFTVSPASPVTLKRDGATTAYPGVTLTASEAGDIAAQDVFVVIPPGRGLEPDREGHPRYMLTVRNSIVHPGDLLADGETLAFKDVNLALSGLGSTSSAWVAVHALPEATLGETRLAFTIGPQVSDSGTVTVVDKTDT